MNGHESILPGNLSELERDLESSLAEARAAIPVPIETIWNPYQCPIPLLPYLAWAVSVDHWQASWPEHTKRSVIAKSLEVHEIKGTRRALEKALSAIDIDINVVEWFEMDPPAKRGTFQITANLSDRGITEGEYQNVKKVIDTAKNVRSHYDLKLALSNKSAVPLYALAIRQGNQETLYPVLTKKITAINGCYFATVAHSLIQTKLYPIEQ